MSYEENPVDKNSEEYRELNRRYGGFLRLQFASTLKREAFAVKQVMRNFGVKTKDRAWTPEEQGRIRNIHLAFTLAGLMGGQELNQWVDCSMVEHGVISCDAIHKVDGKCGLAGIVCCAQPNNVPWCLCIEHAEEFVSRA